ncbi:uncharacterized protein LOC105700769 [Orussus abietinus]|uniref:uncharacterized protein LOC105700769 n=1 Tax=Orussus abietinus TaxID=222816 RepID=UPI000626C31B|nr:uncharacterized protein LOC105700769 [Orussus abietinus]
MARLAYECNVGLRDSAGNDSNAVPFACTADKYCLYCCCNPQCCLLVHRRPPRHFWEAWYFWLGIALLALFLISSVSSYVVSNCRHHNQNLGDQSRNNRSPPRRNEHGNPSEISINIIATPGLLPQHTKMLLMPPQSSMAHMIAIHIAAPIVA